MVSIIIGCLSFFVLFIFDYNKQHNLHRILNLSFAVGCIMLAGSTFYLVYRANLFTFPFSFIELLLIIISILGILLMFYSLFFALPFTQTYVKSYDEQRHVITTGMFALCRHPGVFWFFFAYLALYLASHDIMLLYACIIWTAMDIFHIWIQDIYFFPRTFIGYDEYKKTTPFLIPTKSSISKCISDIRQTIFRRNNNDIK